MGTQLVTQGACLFPRSSLPSHKLKKAVSAAAAASAEFFPEDR